VHKLRLSFGRVDNAAIAAEPLSAGAPKQQTAAAGQVLSSHALDGCLNDGDAEVASASAAAAAAATTALQPVSAASPAGDSNSLRSSVLWKLLHHPSHMSPSQDGFGIFVRSSSGDGGRHSSSLSFSALNTTHSLRSTGLLMTSSAKPCSSSGGCSPHSSTAGDNSRQGGVLNRCLATGAGRGRRSSHNSHHSSLGDAGYADTLLLPTSSPVVSASSTLRRMTQRSVDDYSGAASPGRISRTCTACGSAAGDGALLSGDAGEGGFALRDYIIRQLSAALQQKKSEIRMLRQQLAGVQSQLQGAQGEGAASKQKLQELVEAIQVGPASMLVAECCHPLMMMCHQEVIEGASRQWRLSGLPGSDC